MRRRSERKKSTDVSSPAPASRRGNRRRKSPSVSEEDKLAETNELKNEKYMNNDVEESGGERERDSSEELSENKRRRSSRMRTPVKELGKSPAKRRTRREVTPENKINTILEENNAENSETDNADVKSQQQTNIKNDKPCKQEENMANAPTQKTNKENGENSSENDVEKVLSPTKLEDTKVEEVTQPCNDVLNKDEDDETRSSEKSEKNESQYKEELNEVTFHTRDNSPRSRSNSSEGKQPPKKHGNNEDEEPEESEVIEKNNKLEDGNNSRSEIRERILKRHLEVSTAALKECFRDHQKSEEVNNTQDGKSNESSNTTAAADTGRINSNTTTATTRKRRWITKKAIESKEQILAISTDSLKTLIADVHPVPLSDVQLESSSEVEELASEREEGEQSPSPEPERRRDSIEKLDKTSKLIIKSLKENNRQANQVVVPGVGTVPPSIQRSPSPARNQASNVLYITNLVRPFTVLQLKGLLARTGKIVENGFWIDRIKSKCYVEYETEE